MAKGPKHPLSVDPKIIFRYAEAFADSVELLAPQFQRAARGLAPGQIAPDFRLKVSHSAETAPFMTVDTFALEIYLKCLHAMDRHDTLPWGHDTWQIYRQLKRGTKKRLRDNYALLVSKSPIPTVMKKKHRAMFSNFYSYMKRSNHSFEQVRYLFERAARPAHGQPPIKRPNVAYWPILRQAARKSILDIMPEWAGRSTPTSLLL